MLGKNTITRKHYVKDLYDPSTFLNNFQEVEFSNVKAFINVMQNDLYQLNNVLIINVYSEKELENLYTILEGSPITSMCKLQIRMPSELIPFVRDIKSYEIITDMNGKICDGEFIEWRRNNRLICEIPVNAGNYKRVFDEAIDLYQNGFTRFFDLKIDYASFEDQPISILHELRFRFDRFDTWCMATDNKDKMTILSNGFYKPIYIDEDMELYLTRYKEFSIGKLEKDLDGETMDFKQLSTLLKYGDLNWNNFSPFINEKGLNYRLIDYRQNTKVMGFLNRLPWLTQLILGWFK